LEPPAANSHIQPQAAVVLVLEANSIFLEHLPERYQQQLIAPLNRQIEGLQRLFATREERERAALANSEEIARSNFSTTNRAVAAAETIERALRDAATAIDAQAVSREIKGQIEEKALKPFARMLEELATRSKQMEQATGVAEQSIAKGRKVHLRHRALLPLRISALRRRLFGLRLEHMAGALRAGACSGSPSHQQE
jgi:hypothetical protein